MPRSFSRPGDDCVRSVMRRHFVTIGSEESLWEALQIMRMARLRHLVVEDGGTLAGLLSYRRVQDEVLDRVARATLADVGIERLLSASKVAEAMIDSPAVVGPSTRVRVAADRICRFGLGCLPVVEPVRRDAGARIVGLVTETDLLHAAFARH